MPSASLPEGRWGSIVSRISAVFDLEVSARRCGALARVRRIRSAEALLRLAMMYGPGGRSLANAAALAGDAGIACLTDKAEEHRLRKMPAWLEHILAQLLAPLSGTAPSAALDLRLVDGSVICTPGRGGTD